MNKIYLSFVLLAIVLVSGCVSSSVKTDMNNGLIVNEFTAEPLQAEADDLVRISLDAENVGGTTARCITTELFGVDGWRDQMGQPLSFITMPVMRGLSFSFQNGRFSGCYSDPTRGHICLGYDFNSHDFSMSGFLGSSFFDIANTYCNNLQNAGDNLRMMEIRPELTPPNPSLGRAGQSFTAEWLLRPPVLPEGISTSYPILARTSYFYSTNAQINIQALSKAEFKRRADLGQQTSYPLTVDNSFGSPIQIAAVRGDSPIVVNTDMQYTGPAQIESYKFDFANLGDGFPLPTQTDMPGVIGPATQGGYVLATASINGPGAYFYDCLGQTGQEIFIDGNTLQQLVQLRGDQHVPVSCSIAMDRTQWMDKPVGTVSITFNLWYRYYIDKTINVRVLGVEGLSATDVARGNYGTFL